VVLASRGMECPLATMTVRSPGGIVDAVSIISHESSRTVSLRLEPAGDLGDPARRAATIPGSIPGAAEHATFTLSCPARGSTI
jgi:hypothetical protein